MTLDTVNKNFSNAEEFFNFVGSIPIVGIISGTLRVTAGKVQIVAAIISGSVLAASSIILDVLHLNYKKKEIEYLSRYCFEHALHGCLNVARGMTEAATSASIFGSIALFVIQSGSRNGFNPVFKYGELMPQPAPRPQPVPVNQSN